HELHLQTSRRQDDVTSDARSNQHIEFIRDDANWLKQKSRILNKGDQCAETQRVLHHAVTTEPYNQCNAHGANEINQREKDRIIKNRVDVGFAMLVVDFRKAAQRLGFGVEDLHGLRA